jgi:hypothetical protein
LRLCGKFFGFRLPALVAKERDFPQRRKDAKKSGGELRLAAFPASTIIAA